MRPVVVLHSHISLKPKCIDASMVFAEKSNDRVSIRAYVRLNKHEDEVNKIDLCGLSPSDARVIADELLKAADAAEQELEQRRFRF